MTSPFPKSSSASGEGRITVRPLPNGQSGLEHITYQYPLKLISPSRSPEVRSVLVFLLSYGGGLVGGDNVNITIEIQSMAKLSIVTQGHTKIFTSPSPDVVTRQTLDVRIASNAALCLLPDPVQPFEGSNFEQKQVFRLQGNASLCLLDWVTQGRTARGEDWSFVKWVGRNEVWACSDRSADTERLLARDNIILDSKQEALHHRALRETMHGLALFGTLILRGPLVKPTGDFFLAEFEALPRLGARDFRTAEDRRNEEQKVAHRDVWRAKRLSLEDAEGILWSAANVRGCVVVKFGARTVEAGRMWIGSMLAEEGSIAEHFGDHALMCAV
jgi:urease accessory protein UreH